MSDNDRHSPPVADNQKITTLEAAKLFIDAGLPRSQRSIERYCKSGKMESFLDPDEGIYYVSRESAELLIGQLKEIAARHEPITSATGEATPSVNDGRGRPASADQEKGFDASETKKLTDEIFTLKVNNQAKDQIIIHLKDQIEKDRTQYMQQVVYFADQLTESKEEIGKLKALQAPKTVQYEQAAGNVIEHKDGEDNAPTPAATINDIPPAA